MNASSQLDVDITASYTLTVLISDGSLSDTAMVVITMAVRLERAFLAKRQPHQLRRLAQRHHRRVEVVVGDTAIDESDLRRLSAGDAPAGEHQLLGA